MYDPEPDRVVALQSMKLKYWKDNYGQGKAYADLEKKAIAENKQPPPPQGPIAECTVCASDAFYSRDIWQLILIVLCLFSHGPSLIYVFS